MVQFNTATSFAILALLAASVSGSPVPVTTSDIYERDINELQARGPGGRFSGALSVGRLLNKHSGRLMEGVRKHFGGHSGGPGGHSGGGRKPWRFGFGAGKHSGSQSGGYRAERNPGFFGVHPDSTGRVPGGSHGSDLRHHLASQAFDQIQMPMPQTQPGQQQPQYQWQKRLYERDILDMEERDWDDHYLDVRGYFDELD